MNKSIYYKILFLFIIFNLIAWLDPYADSVNKGNDYYKNKKYKESIDSYDEAKKYIPLKRKESDLAFNKGTAYLAKKSYDKAEEYLKEALKSENSEVQKKALYNLGNLYEAKGNLSKAAESYMNALKIDPQYENARKNLEYLANRKKNDDKDNKDEKNNKDNENKDKNNQDDQQNNNDSEDKQNDKNEDSNQNKKKDDQQNNANPDLSNMSREEMEQLLKDYNNMPVKRLKGNEKGGKFSNEKDW